MLPSENLFKDQQEQFSGRLKQQLQQLQPMHAVKAYGLSKFFQQTINNELTIASLKAQAMQMLATEYISDLEALADSKHAKESLALLEKSEANWMQAAKVIREYDVTGTEESFLLEMRQHTLQFLENKLIQIAQKCASNANTENITLCLGLISTIDYILAESGQTIDSRLRQSYRKMANSFN